MPLSREGLNATKIPAAHIGNCTIGGALVLPTFTPPASASAGILGQIARDDAYIYVCTATNVWERAPITAW